MMPTNSQREAPTLRKRKSVEAEDEGEEEEEEVVGIRELEREVSEMGRRILEYRRTIPDRLLEGLSSSFVSQRPHLPPQVVGVSSPLDRSAQAGVSGDPVAEAWERSGQNDGASFAEPDQRMLEKLDTFRAKTASNIAAMPIILKRMNECIAKIDKLEQCNIKIHPAFTRKL
ncbi:uncharacterized protein [Typha angustifolia]|uniref:uncharacterized protein n=1 Tax=Typha angustifolia TaxID=59011 RepID=UPI003C2EB04D